MADTLIGTAAGTLLLRLALDGKTDKAFTVGSGDAEATQDLLDRGYLTGHDPDGYRLTFAGAQALVALVDAVRAKP